MVSLYPRHLVLLHKISILNTKKYRAILHDPEVFPDPEIFNPERFIKDGRLDEAIRNPLSYAFGFGRRFVTSILSFPIQE